MTFMTVGQGAQGKSGKNGRLADLMSYSLPDIAFDPKFATRSRQLASDALLIISVSLFVSSAQHALT
ncbi:hypothetical protein ABID16_004200 [Rhizobium aquaticum]|uniref:Uncharacterized protein n=1 Tax=Rhizobium aquaticum TaxID=1549636 RepID=A0ABV2J517_9HYPH